MRSRHRLSKFLLRSGHALPGQGVDTAARAVARQAALRGRALAGDVHRLPAARSQGLVQRRRALIDALEAGGPREQPRADGRKAALLPRDRHAHRRRAVRGSRRLRAVREAQRCSRGSSVSCRASTPPTSKRVQGQITKAGPPHARRLLVEAAHHYRHQPAVAPGSRRHARPDRTRVSCRSRGAASVACTSAGRTSRARAASAPGPSRSPAHASSPRSAGRPRPWTEHNRHHPTRARRLPGRARATTKAVTSPLNGPANTGYGQPGSPSGWRPLLDCEPGDEQGS